MVIEITTEKKTELMEHAEKAYEHIGKMLECIENLDQSGKMGQRDGDEWYIRQMQRGYGNRDEMGYRDEMMGERRYGSRYGNRYGMRSGYRDPYYS